MAKSKDKKKAKKKHSSKCAWANLENGLGLVKDAISYSDPYAYGGQDYGDNPDFNPTMDASSLFGPPEESAGSAPPMDWNAATDPYAANNPSVTGGLTETGTAPAMEDIGFGSLEDITSPGNETATDQEPLVDSTPLDESAPDVEPDMGPVPEEPDQWEGFRSILGDMGLLPPGPPKEPVPEAPTVSGGGTPSRFDVGGPTPSGLPGTGAGWTAQTLPGYPGAGGPAMAGYSDGSPLEGAGGLGDLSPFPSLDASESNTQGDRFWRQRQQANIADAAGRTATSKYNQPKNKPPRSAGVSRYGGRDVRKLETPEDIAAEEARLRGKFSDPVVDAWVERAKRFQSGEDPNAFNSRMSAESRKAMEAPEAGLLAEGQAAIEKHKAQQEAAKAPPTAPGGEPGEQSFASRMEGWRGRMRRDPLNAGPRPGSEWRARKPFERGWRERWKKTLEKDPRYARKPQMTQDEIASAAEDTPYTSDTVAGAGDSRGWTGDDLTSRRNDYYRQVREDAAAKARKNAPLTDAGTLAGGQDFGPMPPGPGPAPQPTTDLQQRLDDAGTLAGGQDFGPMPPGPGPAPQPQTGLTPPQPTQTAGSRSVGGLSADQQAGRGPTDTRTPPSGFSDTQGYRDAHSNLQKSMGAPPPTYANAQPDADYDPSVHGPFPKPAPTPTAMQPGFDASPDTATQLKSPAKPSSITQDYANEIVGMGAGASPHKLNQMIDWRNTAMDQQYGAYGGSPAETFKAPTTPQAKPTPTPISKQPLGVGPAGGTTSSMPTAPAKTPSVGLSMPGQQPGGVGQQPKLNAQTTAAGKALMTPDITPGNIADPTAGKPATAKLPKPNLKIGFDLLHTPRPLGT